VLGLLTYLVVLVALRTTQRRHGELPRLPRGGTLLVLAACLVVGGLTARATGVWSWVVLIIAGGAGLALGRLVRQEARVLWTAAGITAGLVLVAKLMVRAHSRWTFVILVAAVTIGLCRSEKVRERLQVLIGVAAAGVVASLLALRFLPAGFSWAKEIAMLLLLWVGFLGTSMATYSGRHIMVDFCRKLVPERGRQLYEGLSALIAAAFCVLLGYLGYLYVFGAPAPMSIYSMDAHLDYTRIPSWVAVTAIPLGLATSALRFFGVAVQAFRGKLAPREEGHR
jgi:TRAP-type C4-dicarboxylate transport system permease small subunit